MLRPICFKVKSSDSVYPILRKAKQLKDTEGYEKVFITPDRTVEERISRQNLANELKKRREEQQIRTDIKLLARAK